MSSSMNLVGRLPLLLLPVPGVNLVSQWRSLRVLTLIMTRFVNLATWLLPLLVLRGSCDQSKDCEWGPYGEWSDCDSCTKLQSRSRTFAVYAQFGGSPCFGDRDETRSCETTQACPLHHGCGNRFRCPTTGVCISQNLVCNGDQDCQGMGDEMVCNLPRKYMTCGRHKMPLSVPFFGLGYDVTKGERRVTGVFDVKSPGGQCRTIYNLINRSINRLPLSIKDFRGPFEPEKDFSLKIYASKWHYAKEIINNSDIASGSQNYPFDQIPWTSADHKIMVVQKDITLFKMSAASPEYLILEEDLWRALSNLPASYNYRAYRSIVEHFGTHYLSEGSVGGSYKAVYLIDEEMEKLIKCQKQSECDGLSITPEGCGQQQQVAPQHVGYKRVELHGGDLQWMSVMSESEPFVSNNICEHFLNWTASIKNAPVLIKKKLRPLGELVKEVPCSGLKRLHMRRAIEEYLSEHDVCHCPPCKNNGLAVMDGQVCKCICKSGTSGRACANSADVEDQSGATDGSWSCWSTWTCSGGQRSRQRTCTNPAPQNGGRECVGQSTETSYCEEKEIEYLKSVEPQCFDPSVPPVPKCGPPPVLINGYVLEPKDTYIVGSKVRYECTPGLVLRGVELECTANQTWSHDAGMCSVGDLFRTAPQELVRPRPDRVSTAGCSKCQMWETCDVPTNKCRCRETADCLVTGTNMCVRIGDNESAVTMSECQAGLLRCKGETVSVVDLVPCTLQIQK